MRRLGTGGKRHGATAACGGDLPCGGGRAHRVIEGRARHGSGAGWHGSGGLPGTTRAARDDHARRPAATTGPLGSLPPRRCSPAKRRTLWNSCPCTYGNRTWENAARTAPCVVEQRRVLGTHQFKRTKHPAHAQKRPRGSPASRGRMLSPSLDPRHARGGAAPGKRSLPGGPALARAGRLRRRHLYHGGEPRNKPGSTQNGAAQGRRGTAAAAYDRGRHGAGNPLPHPGSAPLQPARHPPL